jgi:hypothetical protein
MQLYLPHEADPDPLLPGRIATAMYACLCCKRELGLAFSAISLA